MWPRPIFVLHSHSAPITERTILPLFLFLSLSPLSVWVYATASSPPIMPLLSFPTHTPVLSVLPFHSFIFYCLNSNSQSRPIELELFLILSACICIPLAFLPLGILLLSLPLSPSSPPSLCVLVPSCLFLFFPLLMCASLLSSSSPIRSLQFLYFSLSRSCFFPFPPAKSCNEV